MSVYRHFKGNLYYVIGVSVHTKTEEKMVVYHTLYGDRQMYVRPLNMFLKEVPKEKENPTGQKYRFKFLNEQLE